MKRDKKEVVLPFVKTEGHVSLRERLEELCGSEMSAVLATDGGGQPYTSLVSFALSPDRKGLIFATPKATSKYKNIAKNPRVSVLIDNRSRAKGDIMLGEAITILGLARPVRRGKRWRELAAVLVSKNPALHEFITAPTTALIYIEAAKYIHVGRFQAITVSDTAQQVRKPF